MTNNNKEMLNLIARSNRLGSDPRNTNFAGGNTSAKGLEIDPVTGKKIELLWVKAVSYTHLRAHETG
jgi:rhamnose utilization protein RhaD (predicted bifunctional aldolase and dehydrogenase)